MSKKYLLLFVLFVPILCFAQAHIGSVNYWIDGRWGEWWPLGQYEKPRVDGSYNNFVIYRSYHPSDYFIKVWIDNYRDNIKKSEKRRRIRNKEVYEYTGIIEYYMTEDKTTDNVRNWVRNWYSSYSSKYSQNKPRKVVSSAKIYIQPYKKNPEVFNIFFDGVGIAFSFY